MAITEKVFNDTKLMLNKGLEIKDINRITGISITSINRIKNVDTYAGHKAYVKTISHRAKKPEKQLNFEGASNKLPQVNGKPIGVITKYDPTKELYLAIDNLHSNLNICYAKIDVLNKKLDELSNKKKRLFR